ncbi:MAG TPA: hypothetical protein VF174_09055 [Micromonosporaceae bacterium]
MNFYVPAAVFVGSILVAEIAFRLLRRAVNRRYRRWLAGLPEDDRIKMTHLDDQLEALRRQMGSRATYCRFRYAQLMVQAEDLPAGAERSELVAQALRWERRAERLRRDRTASLT